MTVNTRANEKMTANLGMAFIPARMAGSMMENIIMVNVRVMAKVLSFMLIFRNMKVSFWTAKDMVMARKHG